MSPMWSASITSGSALTWAMEEAAVLITVPYGQSPNPASVVVLLVQAMVAVWVSAQPMAGSPSETVSVTVAGPGLVQVNEGLCAVMLLRVPALADQEYESAVGPPSVDLAKPA